VEILSPLPKIASDSELLDLAHCTSLYGRRENNAEPYLT